MELDEARESLELLERQCDILRIEFYLDDAILSLCENATAATTPRPLYLT